jgi:hypothetical protein
MFLLDEFVFYYIRVAGKKTDAPAIYCDLRGAINFGDVIIVVILLLPLRAYSFVLERHGVVIIRR